MSFRLQLQSDVLDGGELQARARQLYQDLTRELTADVSLEPVVPHGVKSGALVDLTQITVVALGGSMAALANLFKSYITRDRSISIELTTQRGSLKLSWANFRGDDVASLTRELERLLERSANES